MKSDMNEIEIEILNDLRNVKRRLAALESANDPVQDDAGCGDVQLTPIGKALIELVAGITEPKQPPAPEQPKRRRVWVNEYEDHPSCMCHESIKQAEQAACTSCLGQAEFVEILPGDGDVFAERDVLREQMERFAQNKDLGNNPARIARLNLENADKAKGG